MGLVTSMGQEIEHVYAGELHHPQTHVTRWPHSPSNGLKRRVENRYTELSPGEFARKLAAELVLAQESHANWAAYRTAKWLHESGSEMLLFSPEWCQERLVGQMRVEPSLLAYARSETARCLRELMESS